MLGVFRSTFQQWLETALGGYDWALMDAVHQLQTRNYCAELVAIGASPIQRWAVAFDGKSVRVARVEGPVGTG